MLEQQVTRCGERSPHCLKQAEPDGHVLSKTSPARRILLDHGQLLFLEPTRGNHHAASRLELLKQRGRHDLGRGGDDDPVVGRMVRPAQSAVANADADMP